MARKAHHGRRRRRGRPRKGSARHQISSAIKLLQRAKRKIHAKAR